MACCSGASSSRVFFRSMFNSEAASPTRSGRAPGSVTKSRAASRSSFMRRSISSARSPTFCSRCSAANVESMWRMAMTLAMLVAVMTASSSRKLPKVSCPIESENDRIRRKIAAKAAVIAMSEPRPENCNNIRRIRPRGEHAGAERTAANTRPGMHERKLAADLGLQAAVSGAAPKAAALGLDRAASIRGNAGLLDHFCPQRDVGPDDIGELRKRCCLWLAARQVELLAHLRRRQGRVERLADALDDRPRGGSGHHDAKPGRHL